MSNNMVLDDWIVKENTEVNALQAAYDEAALKYTEFQLNAALVARSFV